MKTSKFNVWAFYLIAVIILALPFSASAQNAQTVRANAAVVGKTGVGSVTDYKLNSKLMTRQMPYRVALPANYSGDTQTRYPVIYLLHGLSGHFDNWGSKTKLAEYLAPYQVIVVMPEGENGWYTDSATNPNDRYETYITQELIPEIDKNFRTIADRGHRIVAGLSMGGYGSLKYGLKNPEMFGLVGSFSGALGAPSWTDKAFTAMNLKGAIPDSIKIAYGADDSPTRSANDIYKMVREISPDKIKTLPFFYLDCGTEDFLITNNRDFATALLEKKIPHEFRELPGAHTWSYWEQQIQDFLRLSDRFFKQTKAKAA